MNTSNLLSVHDAAVRLGAAEETVLMWARSGSLPGQERDGTYWFRPEDVAAYGNAYPSGNPPGDAEVNDHIKPSDDIPTR